MDTKDFLSQGFLIRKIIQARRTKLNELIDMRDSLSSCFSDTKVQTSRRHDRMAEVISQILDLTQIYASDIEKLLSIEKEIQEMINSLSRDEYRLILTERYINAKGWELIAEDNHYSVSGVHKIHKLALKTLDTAIPFDM